MNSALVRLVAIAACVAVVAGSAALRGPSRSTLTDDVFVDVEGTAAGLLAAQDADTPVGRIDSLRSPNANTLVITGWSSVATGVNIEVGGRSIAIAEVERRFDVEAATGVPAWGFSVSLPRPDSLTLCLSADGNELDCQPWRCDPDLFRAAFVRRLRKDHPGQRFTAHVSDVRTGCEYELNPDLVITTASVIKVEILGGVLLRAQADGRELSSTELALVNDMMRLSLNPPTSTLWLQLGGVSGMSALDDRFGATNTVQSQAYGGTASTARDRTKITLAVLHGGGPLDGSSTELARRIMARVHPSQQWGVSAGVAGGYTVVNKNGFYPLSGAAWRVGSTGFVADPTGGGYALTIMTDNNETQVEGIELVERIARRINRRLTRGDEADRPFDDAECVTHPGGQTWRDLTLALGLPAAKADEVRLTAGGDGPFRGQLACAP